MIRQPERKLTAIFYADVAQYSRLTGHDELGTHNRVMAVLDFAASLIKSNGGTVLRYAGDSILAEFPSVVAAVESAVTIQSQLKIEAQQKKENKHVQIRIGIHLGEVLQDRNEIFGDGVNIAARLEAAAVPGGICISEIVHEQLANKSESGFKYGGEQCFKNISKPIKVYHWGTDESVVEVVTLHLPSKPSVAVLAFENMSNDANQDFIAEGISEDIITLLSKFKSFFVIARNSSFAFKGQVIDAKSVCQKLGVQYVVEGSVRKAGNKIRITAQLIDAINDKHLWAERYDRDFEDIFAVQDEVTQSIVTAIEPQLLSTERQLARRKPTESLTAWECYQRGLWHIFQHTHQDNLKAIEFQEKAIAIDPEFSGPHAAIAFSMYVLLLMGTSEDRDSDMERGLQEGLRAVALDESDPFAHVGLGRICIILGQHDKAIASFETALELNPSYTLAHYGKAHSLWHCGYPAEAVESHDEAIRLSPRDPLMWVFMASKAIALMMQEKYEQAIVTSRRSQNFPITGIWAYLGELSSLGVLERENEAKEVLNRALQIQPDISLSFIKQALPITHIPSRKHFFGALLKAGVPN